MKKCLAALVICILVLFGLAGITWVQKTAVFVHLLSKEMKVKVALENLDITKKNTTLTNLWIGTPPSSKTSTSFASRLIEIIANPKVVLENPMIIDKISISDISIGVEYYPDQTTNWDYILSTKAPKKKNKGKDYLIRTLILTNLRVTVVSSDGKKKQYPTIERMEFHNISSDSGFPIAEIEKAIFKKVMQDLFDKLNLFKKLPFDALPKNAPTKLIPQLFQ